MKFRSSRASLALAALAVTSIAGPLVAAEQVPFKGNLEGTVTVTSVPGSPPTIVDVLVEGSGNATQLGKFTFDIPHRVNRATRTASGAYHVTAANGDTFSADFTGQSMPTATLGVISITESATITAVRVGSRAQLGASPVNDRTTPYSARRLVLSRGPSPHPVQTTLEKTRSVKQRAGRRADSRRLAAAAPSGRICARSHEWLIWSRITPQKKKEGSHDQISRSL
jgi:hypothetical protein